jgi:hypothetical protein
LKPLSFYIFHVGLSQNHPLFPSLMKEGRRNLKNFDGVVSKKYCFAKAVISLFEFYPIARYARNYADYGNALLRHVL